MRVLHRRTLNLVNLIFVKSDASCRMANPTRLALPSRAASIDVLFSNCFHDSTADILDLSLTGSLGRWKSKRLQTSINKWWAHNSRFSCKKNTLKIYRPEFCAPSIPTTESTDGALHLELRSAFWLHTAQQRRIRKNVSRNKFNSIKKKRERNMECVCVPGPYRKELVQKIESVAVQPRCSVDQGLRTAMVKAIRQEILVALNARPRLLCRSPCGTSERKNTIRIVRQM